MILGTVDLMRVDRAPRRGVRALNWRRGRGARGDREDGGGIKSEKPKTRPDQTRRGLCEGEGERWERNIVASMSMVSEANQGLPCQSVSAPVVPSSVGPKCSQRRWQPASCVVPSLTLVMGQVRYGVEWIGVEWVRCGKGRVG